MNYLEIAKKYKTKKSLGQNFLVDRNVLNTIIEAVNPEKDEIIVEIGAGLGFVTKLLAEKAGKVFAIEIDRNAIAHLSGLNIDNVEIIDENVLNINFSKFSNDKVKVVANIPYYITSPILLHLLGELDEPDHINRKYISEIVIMVQKEVGQRMMATCKSKNKEWGALSVLINYWTRPVFIAEVKNTSFWPVPRVDSVVIKLEMRKEPLFKPINAEYFKKTVKTVFNFRRKTLKNSLLLAGISSNIVSETLKELKLNDRVRGESLSIEELIKLSDKLYLMNKEKDSCNACH